MKKIVIGIVIVVVLVFGWSMLSNARLDIGFLRGKLAVVDRGDLTIPISGTGEIRPCARSEIKPEASGEVVEIPVEPGQLVKADEIIIRLDPEDEDRNVKRARNTVARAEATLKQSKLRLKQQRTSVIARIDSQIASAEAQLVATKYNLDKKKNLPEIARSEDELVQMQAVHDRNVAELDGLQAERARAEIDIEVGEGSVVLATKDLETAETNLTDALERRAETEIRAPISGMISRLSVEVGEVVQGGKTTFTGGTILAVVADISSIIVQTEVADADIGAVLWLAPAEARPGGETLAKELEDAGIELIVATNGIAERISMAGTLVTIEVDSFREEGFEGVIERIYPEPRKIQNIVTYLVDIRVTSPNWKKLALTLGMQADVKFTAQAVKDAILVPHDAIRRGPNGDLGVYIPEKLADKPEPHPKFVPCRFGLDNGLYAELIDGEGIDKGTEVYVELPARFKPDGEDEEDD